MEAGHERNVDHPAVHRLVRPVGVAAMARLSAAPSTGKPKRRRVRTPEQLAAMREYGQSYYQAHKRARPPIRRLEAAWYGR